MRRPRGQSRRLKKVKLPETPKKRFIRETVKILRKTINIGGPLEKAYKSQKLTPSGWIKRRNKHLQKQYETVIPHYLSMPQTTRQHGAFKKGNSSLTYRCKFPTVERDANPQLTRNHFISYVSRNNEMKRQYSSVRLPSSL